MNFSLIGYAVITFQVDSVSFLSYILDNEKSLESIIF